MPTFYTPATIDIQYALPHLQVNAIYFRAVRVPVPGIDTRVLTCTRTRTRHIFVPEAGTGTKKDYISCLYLLGEIEIINYVCKLL